jgi:hypothetical protein
MLIVFTVIPLTIAPYVVRMTCALGPSPLDHSVSVCSIMACSRVRNNRDISAVKLIGRRNFGISDAGYHMKNTIYLVLQLDRGKLTEALRYSMV